MYRASCVCRTQVLTGRACQKFVDAVSGGAASGQIRQYLAATRNFEALEDVESMTSATCANTSKIIVHETVNTFLSNHAIDSLPGALQSSVVVRRGPPRRGPKFIAARRGPKLIAACYFPSDGARRHSIALREDR